MMIKKTSTWKALEANIPVAILLKLNSLTCSDETAKFNIVICLALSAGGGV